MITFTTAFFFFTAILLAAAVPVLIVARRDRLSDTIRHFLIGAGVVGLVCAVGSFTSERLVDQCVAAGSSTRSCADSGTIGFQSLLVAGYAVTAWVRAFQIHND